MTAVSVATSPEMIGNLPLIYKGVGNCSNVMTTLDEVLDRLTSVVQKQPNQHRLPVLELALSLEMGRPFIQSSVFWYAAWLSLHENLVSNHLTVAVVRNTYTLASVPRYGRCFSEQLRAIVDNTIAETSLQDPASGRTARCCGAANRAAHFCERPSAKNGTAAPPPKKSIELSLTRSSTSSVEVPQQQFVKINPQKRSGDTTDIARVTAQKP
ncbi:hypothetical protein KIN20_019103 [Parelaphostrongylus tenuis]|uniref:Uncharacterized protein n=1 Tax=Parelaphostrongylus tenuis TaxID=148309 RepID=A0AAD5MNY6_PARTN|nr:hypothetical protein KIN20_019103 [Parelaphostrongylus tenuis]